MIALALRDLRAHRLRTLLSTLAVVLGVALVTGALVLTGSMTHAADSLTAAAYRDTDAVVTAANAADGGAAADMIGGKPALPGTALRRVAAVPGVGTAAAEVLDEARILDRRGTVSGGGPYFGIGYDFGRAAARRLTPLRLHAGHWPAGPGEVAVDQGTADRLGLRPGSRVRIAGAGGAQPFRVTGVLTFGDVRSLGTATISAFTVAEAQRLFAEPGRIDTVLTAAAPGVAPAALRARLAAALPPGAQVRTAQAQDRFTLDGLRAFVRFLRTILLVLGGVALVVGALTIRNALTMAVGQQARSLALLRAVGAQRGQVRRLVLWQALPLGIAGTVLGLGAGVALAAGLGALFVALHVELPTTALALTPGALAAAVAVGVGVPLLAALRPARRATRITPVAALRDAAAARPRRAARAIRAVAGVVGLPAERLGGVAGSLARRNAMRQPGRTGATAAALLLGVAVVTLAAVLAKGLLVGGQGAVERHVRADYVIASETAGWGPTSDAALRAIAAVPGVRRVAGVTQQEARVRGAVTTVDGLSAEAAGMLRYDVHAGPPHAARALAPGQALVRDNFADAHGLRPGARFTLTTPEGRQVPLIVAATVHRGKLDPMALGDVTLARATFDRAFRRHRVAFGLVDGAGVPRAALLDALAAFPGAYVATPARWGHDLTSWLQTLLAVVAVMLALAAIVSVLGIVNTLALGVVERRRELGLLRAAGMTRRQVRRMIRWESVLTALLGALAGIVTGLALAAVATALLAGDGLGYHVPAGTLAAVVAVAVVAGVAAAALPARRAARLEVLEALSVG